MLLLDCHGHLLEVRCSSGRYPGSCVGRTDDFPLCFCGCVRHEDCLYGAIHATQSLHSDSFLIYRFWRNLSTELVLVRVYVYWRNQAKQGFFNAIVLVMETGFAGKLRPKKFHFACMTETARLIKALVTAFMAVFLNLILTEEIEDEAASFTANEADAADDREEWAQIKHGKDEEEIGEKNSGENVDAK